MTQGHSIVYDVTTLDNNQNMNYFQETFSTFAFDKTVRIEDGRPLYVHNTKWKRSSQAVSTFNVCSSLSGYELKSSLIREGYTRRGIIFVSRGDDQVKVLLKD